ncbi:hypothetical protein SCG7086_BJ_00060 [Chlamydiales bacterium SCGC AG-110-P3]|nr:hypothetical protein SCG7086_BJ_00060 [Chlamydiales bacterium SCGC AG-110-P3]
MFLKKTVLICGRFTYTAFVVAIKESLGMVVAFLCLTYYYIYNRKITTIANNQIITPLSVLAFSFSLTLVAVCLSSFRDHRYFAIAYIFISAILFTWLSLVENNKLRWITVAVTAVHCVAALTYTLLVQFAFSSIDQSELSRTRLNSAECEIKNIVSSGRKGAIAMRSVYVSRFSELSDLSVVSWPVNAAERGVIHDYVKKLNVKFVRVDQLPIAISVLEDNFIYKPLIDGVLYEIIEERSSPQNAVNIKG